MNHSTCRMPRSTFVSVFPFRLVDVRRKDLVIKSRACHNLIEKQRGKHADTRDFQAILERTQHI